MGDVRCWTHDTVCRKGVKGMLSRLFLRGLHQPLVLLGADAVLGEGAPLDAGHAHGPGIDVAALLARRVRLVGPDLHLLAALLAPDLFRFRGAYLCAAGAAFTEESHGLIIPFAANKDMT